MKFSHLLLLPAAVAASFAGSSAAYYIAAGPEQKPGSAPIDCARMKDKARCAALNKDVEACRGKVGDDWRRCMRQPASTAKFTPPKARDCSKARNKERCEAHNIALEACSDKATRAEHRKCMAAQ